MKSNTTPTIALQLYSLRQLSDSFTEIAAAAAQAGYEGVELTYLADHTGEEVKAVLENHGLQAVSAHVSYQVLIGDFAGIVAFHRAVGNDCLILPGPAQEVREAADAEAWRAFGQTLNELGSRCRAEGMRLGYHNHGFEMAEYDGARAIDWLLMNAEAENLFWEPDLAWVAHGGAPPLELVEKYVGVARASMPKIWRRRGKTRIRWAWRMWATVRWTGMRCCRPVGRPAPSVTSSNTTCPKIRSPACAAVGSFWLAGGNLPETNPV